MVNYLITELLKLKRVKVIWVSILFSFLFPIPLTVAMYKEGMIFAQLLRANVVFGEILLLPIILGVICALLFINEREQHTLKNLITVPVKFSQLIYAKLLVVLMIALIYSGSLFMASILGGALLGSVEVTWTYILISQWLGLFVFFASLPMIGVIILMSKNFLGSLILTLVYVVTQFILLFAFVSTYYSHSVISNLPMNIVTRWFLSQYSLERGLQYLQPTLLTTEDTVWRLGLIAFLSIIVITIVYKKQNS